MGHWDQTQRKRSCWQGGVGERDQAFNDIHSTVGEANINHMVSSFIYQFLIGTRNQGNVNWGPWGGRLRGQGRPRHAAGGGAGGNSSLWLWEEHVQLWLEGHGEHEGQLFSRGWQEPDCTRPSATVKSLLLLPITTGFCCFWWYWRLADRGQRCSKHPKMPRIVLHNKAVSSSKCQQCWGWATLT